MSWSEVSEGNVPRDSVIPAWSLFIARINEFIFMNSST